MLDVLITNGLVVDGTGADGRVADLGIRDGRITFATAGESAGRVIDATGLVVSPGFVDLHTHYDAQLLWDPTAGPSPLHGVTSVFGGNCGFTLAPADGDHVDYLSRLMARVEGIPLPALQQGVPWDWQTTAEYLDRVEAARPAVNAGFLCGHSALRRVVMGEACHEPATDAQIDAMASLLRDALAAGALGFSTSRAGTHNDGAGDPVPSRGASDDELLRLADVVRNFPGTQVELIFAGALGSFSDDEKALMAAMSTRSGRPVNWNVLGVGAGDNHWHQLDATDVARAAGGEVVALTMPYSSQLRFSFLSGFVLDGLPGWADVFRQPPVERMRTLSDPDVRARMLAGSQSEEAGILRGLANWGNFELIETFAPENASLRGRVVEDIAAERGAEPFDVLLDVVIADELRTGLRPRAGGPPSEDVWAERRKVWLDDRTVIGGSDAGAHLDLFCNVGYSTFMVGPAVRDLGVLSMAEAVQQLTDVPARLYGLRDRGRIEEGYWGDLAIFDPSTVGPGEERTVADLPGGESRLIVDATGMEHVLVNGTAIVESGAYTGDQPGRLLRAGRDT